MKKIIWIATLLLCLTLVVAGTAKEAEQKEILNFEMEVKINGETITPVQCDGDLVYNSPAIAAKLDNQCDYE